MTLGQLGLHELRAGTLQLGGADETTVAAKRVFGIADTLLLERRASEFAAAGEVPLAALDLALWNWNRPPRPGPAGERDRAALGAVGARARRRRVRPRRRRARRSSDASRSRPAPPVAGRSPQYIC